MCTPFRRKDRDGNLKEYRLSAVQPHHRAMFEAWLRQQAWEAIDQAKKWVSEQTYRVSISELTQDIAAKRYSSSSENYKDAARSTQGIRYLLTIMLRDNHPEADEEWVEAWMNESPEKAVWHFNEAIEGHKTKDSKSGERPAGEVPVAAGGGGSTGDGSPQNPSA